MALIKACTTQIAKLGRWLAGAFGLSLNVPQTAADGDTWTPDTLTNFGLDMGKGFGTGF